MKITEDIILDLLPIYFEGEVSKDSQSLIESYFDDNPDFAIRMRKEFEQGLPELPIIQHPQEHKMTTIKNTQNLLKLRTLLFTVAILSTCFPILYYTFFDFGDRVFEGFNWMWSDIGGIIGILGVLTWVGYLIVRYRMRTSGL